MFALSKDVKIYLFLRHNAPLNQSKYILGWLELFCEFCEGDGGAWHTLRRTHKQTNDNKVIQCEYFSEISMNNPACDIVSVLSA
jgi:hypothetical protein